MILTDSIPLPPAKRIAQIKTFSIAPLIGEAIRRIHRGESVGALFSSDVALTQQMLMWDDGTERTLDLSDDRARRRIADGDPGGRPQRWEIDEPAAPPARRQGRPRAADRPSPRTGEPSSGRRAGARRLRGGKLPRLANSEMNPTSTLMSVAVLGRPGRADLRAPDRRLRDGLLEVAGPAAGFG